MEQTPRVRALWHIHPSVTKDVLIQDLPGVRPRLGAEEVTEVLVFNVPVHKHLRAEARRGLRTRLQKKEENEGLVRSGKLLRGCVI